MLVAYVRGPDGVVLALFEERRNDRALSPHGAGHLLPWRTKARRGLFERSIRALVRRGLRDFIFGTAGEGHSVTESQFAEVTALFVETMEDAGGAPPMVGVINLSLPTVLERIAFRRSSAFGPSSSACRPGAYRRRRGQAVFAEVCDGFPDCRSCTTTLGPARLVRPEEYAELAEQHPNLVAIKYGLGIRRRSPASFASRRNSGHLR